MTFFPLRLLSAGWASAVLCGPGSALAYGDLPWPVADDLGFTLYGRINQSYLNHTDGFNRRGVFTVDNSSNDNGGFVGMRGAKRPDSGALFAGRLEFVLQPRASDVTNPESPCRRRTCEQQ